jgi:UDP-glucose 4-epimerase
MKKNHILVTGGAGYIGSHTVVALLENGYSPVIVDDLRNSYASVLDNLTTITGKDVPFHRVDVCDIDRMEEVFEMYDFDGIIHFAAYKAVGESVVRPLDYYKNNVSGLLTILELCSKHKVENFVFSSSCTVYGEPENQIEVDESCPIREANSPYGQTKIIGEQILRDFQNAFNKKKVVALRYFNPIGAHDSALIGEYPIGKPNNLLPFITQTASGKWPELVVFGDDYPTEDGTCIRDYIHVMDLADAHVKAMDYALKTDDGILDKINIGTGTGSSVLELIKTFEEVSEIKLPYSFGQRRLGDITAIYANATKAKKLLSWSSKRNLKQAVESAWKWEQNLKSHA